ncbi:MAG: glycosyltransferase family 2 protein [Coriobacteriales bacterium]|jgi:glycosyltransferase involved in cell wall biosynthesis|nr:glycosyltransferase family 2 protein [Coriobacteriales bacterium]
MKTLKVAALIPAFNEADTIAATVAAVRGLEGVERVLVIDDGSTDETAAIARQAGAELLRLERNGGKGTALQRGVEELKRAGTEGDGATVPFATVLSVSTENVLTNGTVAPSPSVPVAPPSILSHPDIVLLLDGDLGDSAREAQALLAPVAEGLADMTVGILPKPPGSGGFGVVLNLARSAIRDWGGGYDAQAPLSGQRALSWECLQAVLPFAEGYGVEVALTIRALQQNYRVFELMVDMRHRATGRDLAGFLHRTRQYLDVRRTIQRLAK